MSTECEYHNCMRPSLPASVRWAILLLISLFFVASSPAQVNGAPSSVTSPGFGGRPVNGAPSSVTSVGPRGYTPNFRRGTPGTVPFAGRGPGQHRRHRNADFFSSPLYYAVPVPYAVDTLPPDDAYSNDEGDYQGGPTLFDRRGSGERSYVPPVKDAIAAHAADPDDTPPSDSDPEPAVPTTLVFKDGHTIEVGNYAIVGSTLFDLTPGHSRRVALADLNLDATRKENDDHGVLFQLPPSMKVN